MAEVIKRGKICPTKMTCGKAKKYKDQKLKEIVSIVNAFLNSLYGGTLELSYERNPPLKHVDDCVRAIEQKLGDSIGIVTMFINVKLSKVMNKAYKNFQKIVLHVFPNDSLATVNYNMFLPTTSQVVSIPSFEPLERMRKIIEGVSCTATEEKSETSLTAYQRNFVIDQSAEVEEGVTVQVKSLKSEPSKCITLADRITWNRFPDYVSAFATHLGGHIYYGVNDNGIVEGEVFATVDLKAKITNKVKKKIDKLVWPAHVGVPQRGREWDIFYEPVKNSPNGNPVPQTYVVVVAIARCPGGVFTAAPESYFLNENGDVEPMSVSVWRKKLLESENGVVGDTACGQEIAQQLEPKAKNEDSVTGLLLTHCPTFSSALVDIPSRVPKLSWSSEKNRRIYNVFTKELLESRNNQDLERFNKICSKASKYPDSDAALVCLSERVAVAYKGHKFSLAEALLEKFSSLCTKATVKDGHIFHVRELYLRSRIDRAKGLYAESFRLALVGLQQLQCIEAEFITTWFYMHAAIVMTMLPGKGDLSRYDEARKYLNLAKASLTQLKYFPEDKSDLVQKLCIYMAEILLGFSFSGNALDSRHITIEAIDEAEHELAKSLRSNGGRLTRFRKIQYRIVQSDVAHRKAEFSQNQQERLGNLEQASEFAKKANDLASEHQFEELILYSNTRLFVLSEKLESLRNTIKVTDDSEVLKDLENFIEC